MGSASMAASTMVGTAKKKGKKNCAIWFSCLCRWWKSWKDEKDEKCDEKVLRKFYVLRKSSFPSWPF